MRRVQIQSGGEAQAACLHGSATQEAAGLHAGVGVKAQVIGPSGVAILVPLAVRTSNKPRAMFSARRQSW